MSELLPCPYCGGKLPAREFKSYGEANRFLGSFISCRNCGAQTSLHASMEGAEEDWNQRTSQDELSKKIDILITKIDEVLGIV